jgi:hypothetical protein
MEFLCVTGVEDKLQVDCCSKATFIGLYDGFKGDEASSFLREQFFPSLLSKFFQFMLSSTFMVQSFVLFFLFSIE